MLGKKPIQQGDLEALSLMIHHLYFGDALFDFNDKRENHNAQINVRGYPSEFNSKLPKQLAQVMIPLITYPRDDSITAKDVVSAIKLDYGV